MSKELEKQQPANVPVTVNMDTLIPFAMAGLETLKAEDVLIPRVCIIQALSPQILPKKAEYIPGAKMGDICDVGTMQVLGDSITFIPCAYSKVWIEWKPKRQGLVEIYKNGNILQQTRKNSKNQDELKNGNVIQEVRQLFGLRIDGEKCFPAFLPFSATQAKKCKRLLSMATSERIQTSQGEIVPPLFYRSYIMGVVEEENSEGSWFGWSITRHKTILEYENGKRFLEEAKKMLEMANSANVSYDESIYQTETSIDADEVEQM